MSIGTRNPARHHICKKDYIFNRATYTCENDKYAGSNTGDSVITCDEIVDAERSETLATRAKLHNEVTETALTKST